MRDSTAKISPMRKAVEGPNWVAEVGLTLRANGRGKFVAWGTDIWTIRGVFDGCRDIFAVIFL